MRWFLVAALVIGIASRAGAQTASISAIVHNPSAYDGKHVVVAGTVSDIEEKTSHAGNAYDVFRLCANSCIRVFTFGRPSIAEGQKLTVRGTYAAVKHVGGYTFRNELDADDGSM